MVAAYVSSAVASASSVNLPVFVEGDVAIVVALNAPGTVPSLPAGWTGISSATDGTNAARAGYRVLAASDTSTGTWTGADFIGVAVYRGVHRSASAVDFTALSPLSVQTGSTTAAFDGSTGTGYAGSAVPLQMVLCTTQNVTGTSAGTLQNGTGTLLGVCDTTPGSTAGGLTLGGSTVNARLVVGIREFNDYPQIITQDCTSGTQTSNASTWTLGYPANLASGDLLVGLIITDGNSGPEGGWTIPAGWVPRANNQSVLTSLWMKKVSDSTEAGGFNVTLGNAASEQGSWRIYRIVNWAGILGTTFLADSNSGDVQQAGLSSGTSSTPDSTTIDPSWAIEPTLWIAFMGADASRTVSAFPSNFGDHRTSHVSGGSTGATLGCATLSSTVLNVDPAAWTISASDDWQANALAVRPVAPVPPARLTALQAVKRANSWFKRYDGLLVPDRRIWVPRPS